MTTIRNTRRLAAALAIAIGALTFTQPANAGFWNDLCLPCEFDTSGIPAPKGYEDHRTGFSAGRNYGAGQPGRTRPNAGLPTASRPTFNPNMTGGGRPGQFDNGNRRPNLNPQISGGGRPGAFDNRGHHGNRGGRGNRG